MVSARIERTWQRALPTLRAPTALSSRYATPQPLSLDEIRAARAAIAESAIRTPLVRLNVLDAPAEIYLKLENLQPIGSFKIRGASNAMARAPLEQLKRGVLTASAGNMAQGVAAQSDGC